MADPIRKRLVDLINLAASPHRAEAEAAAWKACRLIRQHGLEIVDPVEMDALLKEAAELKVKVKQLELQAAPPDDDDDYFAPTPPRASNPFRQRQYSSHQTSQSYVATHAGTGPSSAAFGHGAYVNQQQPMTAPRAIRAAFDSQCMHCKKAYKKGDDILWQKGVGTWCAVTDCYAAWRALQNFNPTAPFNSTP